MALVFLQTSEFLYTIDKLYISRFFAIRRCKPRKTSHIGTKMHPETHQNPTKSTLEKTLIFVTDFGMILASKMTPKWPQNPPKWHPWDPKGPLGAPWGSHGAHQMLQDRFLAPISKTNPKSTKMAPLGSQETPWGAMGPIRCLKIVFSFILAT